MCAEVRIEVTRYGKMKCCFAAMCVDLKGQYVMLHPTLETLERSRLKVERKLPYE
jgi:hypothetical protein